MSEDFTRWWNTPPAVLAEGAVIERLRRMPGVRLDRHVAHTGFLYDPVRRSLLVDIYREYLDIGQSAGLPLLCLTPTWRANPERLERAGLSDRQANADAVAFLQGLRQEYGSYASQVTVGGLIGCRGDAYTSTDALDAEASGRFHRPQIEELAGADADFLAVSTLPSASEAIGIARAMAQTNTPYLLSFVADTSGRLMDTTPLADAISSIDDSATPAPVGYLLNCVHHSVFATAVSGLDAATRRRIVGLQANTSSKPPAELDGLAELETENPDVFADAMVSLHDRFGIKVLGGCCGTDGNHIRRLAERLTERPV